MRRNPPVGSLVRCDLLTALVTSTMRVNGDVWVTLCEEPACVSRRECRCSQLSQMDKELVPVEWCERVKEQSNERH